MYFKKNHQCENCTLPFRIVWSCKKTSEDIEKIRELASQGLQKTVIAKELGIARATVYRALEN